MKQVITFCLAAIKKSFPAFAAIAVLSALGIWLFLTLSRPTYTLFAGGDALLARWQHHEAYSGTVEESFGDVLDTMKEADLALVNLECVISNRGKPIAKNESRPYYYRARPEMVRFLADSGINIVSQANNHAGDYGPQALVDSASILQMHGITPLGFGINREEAFSIQYVSTGSITTAWIAFYTGRLQIEAVKNLPGILRIREKNIEKIVIPMIREAKEYADLVFITPHWGGNWKKEPTPLRQKMARAMIDAGANAILGHSAHILQGIEIYKERPIIYDMGTFYWDNTNQKELNESMVFLLDFSRDGIKRVTGKPIKLANRRVAFADEATCYKIIDTVVSRSESIGSSLDYTILDKNLLIELKPQKTDLVTNAEHISYPKPQPRTILPPFDMRSLPPYVIPRLPDGINQSVECTFKNGIKIMGVTLPDRVTQKTAFFITLYLETDRAITSRSCSIMISLYPKNNPRGKRADHYIHEPGDWAYPTYFWKKGQIIEDRTIFRPYRELDTGFYEVQLEIGEHLEDGTWRKIKLLETNQPARRGRVKIGEIEVVEHVGKGIPAVEGLVPYRSQKLDSKSLNAKQ